MTDDLMERARPLAAAGVPSKTKLQKALGVGWDRAVEIHRSLSAEHDQARSDRRRAYVTRLRTGRATAGRLPSRIRPLPVAPVSPAVQAAHPAPIQGPVPPPVTPARRVVAWPLVLLALPAFVAIWSGWVDLGRLTGFGVVHPLPGIWDEARLNTAITLPVGLETYAAYALYVWLSAAVPATARRFAKWSAIGSLALGAAGQVAYHLMTAAGMVRAPWEITTVVSCLPVAVLGMGAALWHLVHAGEVPS